LERALQHLISDGKLERTLGCYREVMMQRDVTDEDLKDRREADHRESFQYCLLKNPYLVPRAEVKVKKVIDPLLTIS